MTTKGRNLTRAYCEAFRAEVGHERPIDGGITQTFKRRFCFGSSPLILKRIAPQIAAVHSTSD